MLVSSEAEERNNRRISVRSKGRREGEEMGVIWISFSAHPTKLVVYINSLLHRKADSTGNKLLWRRLCRASRRPDGRAERPINTDSQAYYGKERQMAPE